MDKPALTRHPRSVAIVGYSNINLKYAKESKADELWTMNHHMFLQERDPEEKREIFRCDRLFELHKPEWFTRKEIPDALLYRKWLQEDKPFPIYMLEASDEFPASVKFPREALKHDLCAHHWRGAENEQEYYTSSVAFMIAYAVYLGVERIEFYGVEALTDTEYADQKPAIEFWIGFAQGRGIDTVFHPTCSLCNNQVYGYEGVPHIKQSRLAELLVHYTSLRDKAMKEGMQAKIDFKEGKIKDGPTAMEKVDMAAIYSGGVVGIEILQNEHDEYISAQFLEEKYQLYRAQEEHAKGNVNMLKSEYETLQKKANAAPKAQQKKELMKEAMKSWSAYQDRRAAMHAISGAIQVFKKLREECRLGKPDHHLMRMIVE